MHKTQGGRSFVLDSAERNGKIFEQNIELMNNAIFELVLISDGNTFYLSYRNIVDVNILREYSKNFNREQRNLSSDVYNWAAKHVT